MRINEAMPSATITDWSGEHKTAMAWSPSRSLLASLRSNQKLQTNGFWGIIPEKFAVLCHRFWSVITGCELTINTKIAGRLLFPYRNGVVVYPTCKIGPHCLILQQATLGTNGSQVENGVPTPGGYVDIGAGAKILGSLTIGDPAVISANAGVLSAVPTNAVAIGFPARIILRGDRVAS